MDAVAATILPSIKGAPAMSAPLFHRASLWQRFSAHLLDRLLFYGSWLVPLLASLLQDQSVTDYADVPWVAALLFYIFFPGYLLWFFYSAARGSTPGKRLCKLKMITSEGRTADLFTVVVRETLGKLISSLLGIGFFWAFFNYYDRALHDIIFDTHVVEAEKYNKLAEQQSEE